VSAENQTDPPPLASYKLAQRELEARLQRRRYLSVDGVPAPDGPYALREQQKGGRPTGVRKMVRKDRLS
jgi:hypothetical protein